MKQIPMQLLRNIIANDDFKRLQEVLETEYSKYLSNNCFDFLLLEAVMRNRIKIIEYLLNKGCNVNGRTIYNETPLICAVKLCEEYTEQRLQIIKMLLEAKADPQLTDHLNKTAFDYLLENENIACACTMLLHIDSKKEYDMLLQSMLMCSSANIVMNRFLNSVNAVKYKTSDGHNLLHIATTVGDISLVKYYINAGCNVNDRTYKNDLTPLLTATNSARKLYKSQIIAILLEAGAKIRYVDYQGKSALHYCAMRPLKDSISIDILINAGIPVNVQDVDENTPLHLATQKGNIDAIRFLLKQRASLNIINKYGFTPLHEAVRSLAVLKYDRTKHFEILKILLQNGADPNAHIRKEIITPFQALLGLGDCSTTMLFLEYKADVYYDDFWGASCLQHAAKNSDSNVLMLIIKRLYPSFKVVRSDITHLTALHAATKELLADNVSILCRAGADVNARDDNNNTPLLYLFYANTQILSNKFRMHSLMKTAEILIDHGADINAINLYGVSLAKLINDFKHKKAFTVILKQMAILDMKHEPVLEELKKSIEQVEPLLKYYEKCTRELKRLKSIYLSKNVTGFDVLSCSRSTFSKYAEDLDVIISINFQNWSTFHVYAETILRRFREELNRMETHTAARQILESVFPQYTREIVERIMSHMSEFEVQLILVRD